jgi:hypothetical protein
MRVATANAAVNFADQFQVQELFFASIFLSAKQKTYNNHSNDQNYGHQNPACSDEAKDFRK